jgi:penicillin-binding protein 1A
MRIQRRTAGIIGVGAAALLATAVSTGAASAATGTSSPVIHKVATAAAQDTDKLQQGDQTTPDVPGAKEKADPTDAPDAGAAKLATYRNVVSKAATEKPGTEVADGNQKAGTEKPGTEKPGTEVKDSGTEKPGTETADGNDGPGGHADPAGAVDHQFEGNE